MSDDDFLWECALLPSNGKDRANIIPDMLDLTLPENNIVYESKSFCCSSCTTVDSALTYPRQVFVTVHEERGSGVVDIIGGEVWEAALLLCGYITMHLDQFLNCKCMLELGSGVGLPALYLMHLLYWHHDKSSMGMGSTQAKLNHVVMSDYDSRLLYNLERSVCAQFHTTPIPTPSSPPLNHLSKDTCTGSLRFSTSGGEAGC
ncbi:hypothetical protein EON65_29030 [archaeon]|nr:MAG: hypothetical protein EON65_29030 [archaeon]